MANILAFYVVFVFCANFKLAHSFSKNTSSSIDGIKHNVIPKKSDSEIGEQDNKKKSETHELFNEISFIEFIKVLSSRMFEYKKPLDFTSVPGVSSECKQDFAIYLNALKAFEFWALKSKLKK